MEVEREEEREEEEGGEEDGGKKINVNYVKYPFLVVFWQDISLDKFLPF